MTDQVVTDDQHEAGEAKAVPVAETQSNGPSVDTPPTPSTNTQSKRQRSRRKTKTSTETPPPSEQPTQAIPSEAAAAAGAATVALEQPGGMPDGTPAPQPGEPPDEQPKPVDDPEPTTPEGLDQTAPYTAAATARPSTPKRAGGFNPLWIVAGIIPVAAIVLLALFLPRWLGLTGYTTLNTDTPFISHSDGITVRLSEGFEGKLRVRLNSTPRADWLAQHGGTAAESAALALVDRSDLEAKSPFYEIAARGELGAPVFIEVLVPNAAEPWETLDLYTWNGETWEWLGARLNREQAGQETLVAEVTELPSSVVVMQTVAQVPVISADATALPAGQAAETLTEINPTGLLLGSEGGIVGDPAGLPQPLADSRLLVIPTIRNWAPGSSPNAIMLEQDVLSVPEFQQRHVDNLVQLVTGYGFAGLDVDYRGVSAPYRDAYSAFIGALATALQATDPNLRLTVAVETPTRTADGWDTGGYDWQALGAVADALRIAGPDDPAAYAEGGDVQTLLAWAVSQVNRAKLRLAVSALSVDRAGSVVDYVTLADALAHMGQVSMVESVASVEPHTQVTFQLDGSVLSITPVDALGTYRLECTGEDQQAHTIWLGTPYALAQKLAWARRFNLGGASVYGLLAEGDASESVMVAASYAVGGGAGAPGSLGMTWTVSGASGVIAQQETPLTEPVFRWVADVPGGDYSVGASVAGIDRGSVSLRVGTVAALTPTRTLTTSTPLTSTTALTGSHTSAVAEGEDDEETPEVTGDCLNGSYVADVTVPDNTRFDKGAAFTKTWRMRNSGSCAWPADTALAFASGSQMGAPESVEVGSLAVGETVEISVDMTAPEEDGRYEARWQLKTVTGTFGSGVTVVIQVGEQPATPTPTPGGTGTLPPPITGGAFELGGHIRDGGFPYASQMHYAGMNWAKVQAHYGGDVSGIVAAAHANGFKIQVSGLGSPSMVTQPGFETDFANWMASVARAGADAIEVWNEPNIEREWQIGYISPQAYTNLLCAAYRAIKEANPNAIVISAAPAPTGYFGGCGPNGCDDAYWVAGLRDAGAVNCMDYVGAHHNAGATSPSASSGHPADGGGGHHSWYFLPQTRLYYNTLGRKLFYTELGYASQEGVPGFSDMFAWARGITNAQQAAWLAEAASLGSSTGMVRAIIVWNIDFVRYDYDPQDGFAIIRPGGACPACDSLHAVLGTR